MKIQKMLNIKPKMVLFFLLTGLIPLVLTGYVGTRLAKKALLQEAFLKMEAIQSIRSGQLIENFENRLENLKLLTEYEVLNDLFTLLSSRGSVMTSDSRQYEAETAAVSALMEDYIQTNKYQDFYLIEGNSGKVLFSVQNKKDLGTSLSHGRYRDSGLAVLWEKVMKTGELSVVDFTPYEPDGNIQYAFLGAPLYDRQGTVRGVAALRIGTDFISDLLDSRQGMGDTGESYILRWFRQNNTFSIRSRIFSMDLDIGYMLDENLAYWDDAVRTGTGGGSGTYVDSIGNQVLVTYNALNFSDLDWFLISKIDQEEVTRPLRRFINNFIIIGTVIFILIVVLALLIAGNITGPILQSKDFAYEIAHGDLNGQLSFGGRRDELGELGESLNLMCQNLREMDWLKSGKEGLDDTMRGEWELQDLCQRFIRFMVTHMDAQMGAVYLKQENQEILNLTASYAFTDRDGNFTKIPFGSGMIGQAAMETEPIYFSNITEQAPPLNFGVSEKIPPYFLISPLLYEEMTLGVFLIGSLSPFDELKRKFVKQNITNAAIIFNTVKSREIIDDLLRNAQEQQEELRVINEELEAQTHALKESEAELQAQQEELRVTNEELEERTKALEEKTRSVSIKNSELQKAQKEVEKKAQDLEVASRYKSEFLANMSHELRTPLNSILILSQLFSNNKEGNLTEKQLESARAIHSSGSDLLKLINEILDLSKVEAGKIEVNPEDMPVGGIISDLKRVFKDMAEEKKIHFEIEKAREIPDTIYTDSHRLQQVLRNLLTNAIKFTEPGGRVKLSIREPDKTRAGQCGLRVDEGVAFMVSDTGIGIPEEKQAAIFEAFQQADGSTSRKYGGTGLGLSISRELSKLLGGNLFLDSQVGKGSTFTMIIPRMFTDPDSPAEDESGQTPEAPEEKGKPEKPAEKALEMMNSMEVTDDRHSISRGDKSLLIIEDDPRFIRILKDLAQERGFKCLIAEDGETGLHFADYYHPKAIILDIGLPGIDGWTVMERLKQDSTLRHIPVHFISGSDSSMEAMRMGAVGFLTKPVSLEKLNDAFSRMEQLISRNVRKLLIVEDNALQRESIRQLIADNDVEAVTVGTGREACEKLLSDSFDCMILDLGLEDMSGFELLEKIQENKRSSRTPVIIYTGRDLSREEEEKLRKYSESIIIKGVKSPERLLDESALFLHRIEAELPLEKQKMLKKVHHGQDEIFKDKKILLVDDDMRNVFALSSVLEEKNMEVIIAKNGVECLKIMKEHKDINLILMDIMMPEMDGYEAMRQIRKQPLNKKLPIIALTAKAMKGDRNKCIEAGASDYLAKPVETDKLLSMLKVWLYE